MPQHRIRSAITGNEVLRLGFSAHLRAATLAEQMLTARKYRNRASKLVILSIGSRRESNAFGLPVPREIGAVRRSFKARNGKFESTSLQRRVNELSVPLKTTAASMAKRSCDRATGEPGPRAAAKGSRD